MTFAFLAAFLALAIPTFFTPGPNNLMLMASSAKFGLGPTLPHMLGICVGFPLMVFVVGLGLGEVFTAYPWLKTVLKWVAAANLLWLAWQMLGLKVGSASAGERPLSFLQAALFQWVNPKAWAMSISLVALVVQPGDARIATLVLLALSCLAISPFSGALWMVGGTGLKALLARTGGERLLGPVLAGLMVIAVLLFVL